MSDTPKPAADAACRVLTNCKQTHCPYPMRVLACVILNCAHHYAVWEQIKKKQELFFLSKKYSSWFALWKIRIFVPVHRIAYPSGLCAKTGGRL
jgi:hypothetical protein